MLPFVSAMANASLPNGSFAEALKWPQQAHEIGEEVDVDPTSHEATTAPVDVLKHWTPLPISPVETRTCAPSAEVSKMPPVLTNDFEAAEENGEEDEGDAIWNGAETPANAEVALNSPDASNVAASPSHAMAKISFAAQNFAFTHLGCFSKFGTDKREIWPPPPRSPGLELLELTRKSNAKRPLVGAEASKVVCPLSPPPSATELTFRAPGA